MLDGLSRLRLLSMLKRHEGCRLMPYQDSVGVWTIGWGHNLEARGVSQRVADLILDEDLGTVEAELEKALPWMNALSMPRQAVLLDMSYNLGVGGLLGFHRFLAALQDGDWESAGAEMMGSRWARQVGDRAKALRRQIVEDRWTEAG